MPRTVERVRSIEWRDRRLFLLDQTKLPVEVVVEEQRSVEQVWESIKQLKVRGAPAIGVAGAYGLAIAMGDAENLAAPEFLETLQRHAEYLDGARPTAVNLHWALSRVVSAV